MLKTIRNSLIVTSVLYIILGVILVIYPDTMLKIACTLIGAVTLIYGAVRVFGCMRDKENKSRFEMVVGILLAALGIFLLVCPQLVASVIPVALGLYIFVDSFTGISKAWEMKAQGYDRWWVGLLISLVVLVLGAILVLNPLLVWELPMLLIGIGFIVDGVGGLLNTILADRARRD